MSTKPDPARASYSPLPEIETIATLTPLAQAHQAAQEHPGLAFHQLEIVSNSRPAASADTPVADSSAAHLPAAVESSKSPTDDNSNFSERRLLDTSRRYSSGHIAAPALTASARSSPSLGNIYQSPAAGGSTIANKRRSLLGGQTPTLTTLRESATIGLASTTAPSATRNSTSGYHTYSPDFNLSQDPDHNHSSTYNSVPHSPAFSVSSFSGIIPSSASISSIVSTGHSKPPALEHKQPIAVKDFDSILILGPSQKAAIKTLCSSRILSRIDTIGWYSILGAQKFPTIISSQDAYDIEMATTCMAIEFGANNAQTQNFNTLVLQLLSQLKLIKDQDYKGDIPSHAYNALFLTRIFLNHFISHLTASEMVSFFEGSNLSSEAQQQALGIVSFKGCKLGVDQMLVSDPRSYAEQLIQGVIDIILNLDTGFSHLADQLTLRLIWNFTDQRPSPPAAGSLVYNAYSYLFAKAGSSPSSEAHPIADRSILVLLLLHSQAKVDPSCEAFKKSIQSIRDERDSMMDDQKDDAIFTSFRKIFHYLPILRMVYESVEGKTNYSQVYVLLVIMLLFSQDEVFNDSIQKITMTYQPWFTERLLKSISLGGLAVAIVIRTIQYNLALHKDVYFHTNSLAILANMSNSLQDIHPYVSQRLVTLFDIVARRYQKLVTKHQQRDEDIEKSADVIIYGDMVTLVLEIINSTLTHKLKANPQLVYSLLHKQEMFAYFRNDPKFKDLIHNIEQAVNYFQVKVSEANIKAPTPEEVAKVIQTASRTWPPNLMKTFPDVKFEYEEEEQSSEFFCPYIWSLLYRNTFVYWDEEKARILHDYRTVMNDEHAFEGVPTSSQAALS
ncbi:hypothetical protein BGZ50_008179 [Haplosporangium sp. Z 11]|nr:hypothetical protein BGZ50_008179 [Haplosporangium sp. Z 11]